jgi:C4-dicarboxylate transporter
MQLLDWKRWNGLCDCIYLKLGNSILVGTSHFFGSVPARTLCRLADVAVIVMGMRRDSIFPLRGRTSVPLMVTVPLCRSIVTWG